jgi:hypothetical protein
MSEELGKSFDLFESGAYEHSLDVATLSKRIDDVVKIKAFQSTTYDPSDDRLILLEVGMDISFSSKHIGIKLSDERILLINCDGLNFIISSRLSEFQKEFDYEVVESIKALARINNRIASRVEINNKLNKLQNPES